MQTQHVRKCTISDADFCVKLARQHYADEQVDWDAIEEGAHNILADTSKRLMVVRTGDSVVVAACTDWFYAPGVYTITVIMFYGSAWGVIACLREVIRWGTAIGAIKIQIDALYKDIDVKPLLKRVGWKFEEGSIFTISLSN